MRRKRTKREELEREEVIRRMLQDGHSLDDICDHPKVDMFKGNLKRKIKLMEKQGKLSTVTHDVDTSKLDAIDEQIEKIELDLVSYEEEQKKQGLSLKENLAITETINRLRREKRLAQNRRDKLVMTPTTRPKTKVKKKSIPWPQREEMELLQLDKEWGTTREETEAHIDHAANKFNIYLEALRMYAYDHNIKYKTWKHLLEQLDKKKISTKVAADYAIERLDGEDKELLEEFLYGDNEKLLRLLGYNT